MNASELRCQQASSSNGEDPASHAIYSSLAQCTVYEDGQGTTTTFICRLAWIFFSLCSFNKFLVFILCLACFLFILLYTHSLKRHTACSCHGPSRDMWRHPTSCISSRPVLRRPASFSGTPAYLCALFLCFYFEKFN